MEDEDEKDGPPVQVVIYLPAALRAWIMEQARREGVSRNRLITRLVREYRETSAHRPRTQPKEPRP